MNTTTTPAAWVGCLNCYNNGRLIGEWFDLDEHDNITLETVHDSAPSANTTQCEELWVMDHENMPFTGECSPADLEEWADAYAELGDDNWDAFTAWTLHTNNTQALPSTFADHYIGHYDSFREYCDDYINSTGILDDIPEHLTHYFDYDAYANDARHNYTIVDAADGGVYIFTQ